MTTATTNEPVFLTLDMDPAEALQHLMAGRVQAPAYLEWNEAKLTAAKNLAAKANAGKVCVKREGAAGMVTLSGALKACGRKGFDPNFSPAVWVLIFRNRTAILESIRDNAAEVHAEGATRKTISPVWEKWNDARKVHVQNVAAGKAKGDFQTAEPKPKFVESAHPRVGEVQNGLRNSGRARHGAGGSKFHAGRVGWRLIIVWQFNLESSPAAQVKR